jgi:cell wall-associated NlpC family hydrolase
MTADDVIAAARECLELPFRHQGRFASGTVDCAGVVVHVATKVGVEFTDRTNYGRAPANGMLEAMLDCQPSLQRILTKQYEPGDILLMRFRREPQHLAIYCGGTIVHSYQTVGKVCEHDLDKTWADRIVRVYRFQSLVT